MQIDIDLAAQMAALTLAPAEQNKLAEDFPQMPAVVFFRRDSAQDLFLDGMAGLTTTDFDVEIYGVDVDAVEAMADTLKGPNALHGFRGLMGQSTVLGAFVSDHASDYLAKSDLATDEGLHSATFALLVIHY